MKILKAKRIDYDSATDQITVTSRWINPIDVRRISNAVKDGTPHEAHEVLGWGDATHRLRFTNTWGVLDHRSDPIGYDFLIQVERERTDVDARRRPGETVGQWTARMLGETRDV